MTVTRFTSTFFTVCVLLAVLSTPFAAALGENWTEATATATWSQRGFHQGVAFDGKLWVLGGYNGDYYNDVWYSSDGVNWTYTGSPAAWAGRALHQAVVFDGQMFVIGGYNGGYYADVWSSVDGSNWTELTPWAAFLPRFGHQALAFDGKLWVLGGSDSNYPLADVWYSSDGASWDEATATAGWSARYYFTTAVFDGKMWVMGGTDSNVYFNDVWWSVDGVNWTEATAAADWSARDALQAVAFDGRLWVFGGTNGAQDFNDVWWSVDGSNWTEATAGANWSAREFPVSAVFEDTIWLFGGWAGFAVNGLNDVWYMGNYTTPPPPSPECNISASAQGESISVYRGEPVILTAHCLYTCGAVTAIADNASVLVRNVDGTIVVNGSTTPIATGVFSVTTSFPETGDYLAAFTCNFPGENSLVIVDDIGVSEPWASYLLPLLGIILLFWARKNPAFLFMSGACFILTIFILHPGIVFSIILTFISIGLFYEAARKK